MSNDGKKYRLPLFLDRKLLSRLLAIAVILCLFVGIAETGSTTSAQTATQEATSAMNGQKTQQIVDAANAFLAKLDESQRAKVLFDFNNTAQKKNWSNYPTGTYNRAGLDYGDMNEQQRAAVMTLLKAVLSEEGYQKVINIMTSDEILGRLDTGTDALEGFAYYFISILGTPSATAPWMIQWGGHHLALNITFDGSNEVLTPTHTGCDPCSYFVNDQKTYVLGDEYSKALKLVNALDADQKAQAVLTYAVSDLVLGPGQEDRVLAPEGLPGSKLTADQQAMLLDIISEWVNITTESAAATRMAALSANINDTYFAWSGDISENSTTSYFRITGPTLLIEFSPQGGGPGGPGGPGAGGTPDASGGPGAVGTPGGAPGSGNPPGRPTSTGPTVAPNSFKLNLGNFGRITDAGALYHVHTIYRDPTNAYGSAIIGK
jgi:hypothetical protein